MTVLELMSMNSKYRETLGDLAIIENKRVRLGFRGESQLVRMDNMIDFILLDHLTKANRFLSKTSNVRVPAWMGEENFNAFTAKISLLCN